MSISEWYQIPVEISNGDLFVSYIIMFIIGIMLGSLIKFITKR